MTREERLRQSFQTSTPPEVLTRLSRDRDFGVRYCVAYNLSTPLELLLILIVDDDEYVRQQAEVVLSKRVKP